MLEEGVMIDVGDEQICIGESVGGVSIDFFVGFVQFGGFDLDFLIWVL